MRASRRKAFPGLDLLGAAILVLILAGCGGGGGSGSGTAGMGMPPEVGAPEPPATPPLRSLRNPPSAGLRGDGGGNVGIGPAFAAESPEPDDLTETSRRGAFEIRSGRWRDARGRDGSASAAAIVDFLKASQTETHEAFGPDANLVFIDFGRQKTLRIGGTATRSDRAAVLAALRNINASLPWEHRILLGPDIAERLAGEEIPVPEGEIHVHITDGKTLWPEDVRDHHKYSIGTGGAWYEERVAVRGLVYIDRSYVDLRPGVGRYDAKLERVVTHEILHAMGIGAHADPDAYPDAILIPFLPHDTHAVPRLWLTLEGDALLAEVTRIAAGTRVAELKATDLGPWNDTGFHLLGAGSMGTRGEPMRFGVGYRNGLGKPWAWGPAPETRLQDNPALSGMATWRGDLLGFTGAGRTVAGNARIGIEMTSLRGRADFTELESWRPETHPGAPGSGRVWGDGDLGYAVEVGSRAGAQVFVSASAPGDDPGVVTGTFVGARHEGAAGVLEHPDLSAAFGAVR